MIAYFGTLLLLIAFAWIFNQAVRRLFEFLGEAELDSFAGKVGSFLYDVAYFFSIKLPESDPEIDPTMWRYPEVEPGTYCDSKIFEHPDYKKVAPIIIVVDNDEAKQQVLKACEYLHDQFTTDTDYIAVNELVHIYTHPASVVVDSVFADKHFQ